MLIKKKPLSGKQTFRAGWPDKVVDGVAVEEKKWKDKMRPNQRACHDWLYQVTGKYPLIEATDEQGTTIVFKNYMEFEEWLHFKGMNRNLVYSKSLTREEIQTLQKAGLCKPVV